MTLGSSGFTLNMFDIVVFTILFLSIAVAFFRGFIREILSLGAWVGAAIITVYLFPHTTDLLKHHVKSDHLAAGGAALGTYIAALIGITIFNSLILRYVKTGAEVGLLDNFLGLIFGALRGAFMLSLGYLILMAFISKDNPPPWFKGSITAPYLDKGSALLAQAAPQYLSEIEGVIKKEEAESKDDSSGTKDPDLMNAIHSSGADYNRGQ